MSRASAIAAAAALAVCFKALAQDEQPRRPTHKPPEESRLDDEVFREALKRRGLTELLDLHLRDFPPPGRTARRLMERDVKLAVVADLSLSHDARLAAAADANDILQGIIINEPGDPRRFEWRFALAHSLIYDQAEPILTKILYRGTGRPDRDAIRDLTTRAVDVLLTLKEELAAEYERIEDLDVKEFERLERTRFVEQIDLLGPKTEYLLAWARFFDSLARDAGDPARAAALYNAGEYFSKNHAILETPHQVSRTQIQALLLAGMTARRLNDHLTARSRFQRALRVVDGLSDDSERIRLEWAVTLLRIEHTRNEIDAERFDEAAQALAAFRRASTAEDRGKFGLELVAALLERALLRARAAAAEKKGRPAEKERLAADAWRALERFAENYPQRRAEVYATVYETLDPDADAARLDPFEQCALVAGLLYDASQAGNGAEVMLDRAVSVAEHFISVAADDAPTLLPQVLYNMGVAHYRRGRTADAARLFIEVSRRHADFLGAPQAAAYAVQLAADVYADSQRAGRAEAQTLYLDALETLVNGFPDAEAASYWRFFYAQLLDELERHDDAAQQYARVHPGHDHHLESTFLRVRCLALALHAGAADKPEDVLSIRRRADEFLQLQRDFVTKAGAQIAADPDSPKAPLLREWSARARLMAAEVLVLPQIDRCAQALEGLAEFDATLRSELHALAGGVWRVRLLAYERLGRLDDLRQAVPAFLAADAPGASATLQSIYARLAAQARDLQSAGDAAGARRKSQLALVLAEQLSTAAELQSQSAAAPKERELAVQLGEAHLAAGNYEHARALLEPSVAAYSSPTLPDDPVALRALYAYAESLFQLEKWSSALQRFNRLATGLKPAEPVRWKSLLRDLQCRTRLGHDPHDIIRVIEQQRFLYPKLGGDPLAAEFDKIHRENKRRADAPVPRP